MILECEECGTRFLVDDKKIGIVGRMVRCASCGHKWFAEPPTPKEADEEKDEPQAVDALPNMEDIRDSEEEAAVQEAEDSSEAEDESSDNADAEAPSYAQQMPAEEIAKTSNKGMVALCAALLLAVIFTAMLTFRGSIMAALPATEGMFTSLGYAPTDGLVLAEVAFKKPASRSRDRFLVTGYIVNNAQRPRKVPMLKVSLVDEEGEIFLSREYIDDKMLQPGERFAFKASRLDTAFRGRTKTLLVDIGNGYEISLRE